MTTAVPLPLRVSTGSAVQRATVLTPHAAMVLVLAVCGLSVTHASGGRDAYALAPAFAALAVAAVAVRAWSGVRVREVVLALAPAVAAVVVCLTAPTSWDGLDDTARLLFVGLLYLVVRGYATTVRRRQGVAVALMLLGLDQFAHAWWAWWGGQSVTTKMVGTFYWHNQFAAFELGAGVVAGAAAVLGRGRTRLVGACVAPFCFAGIVLSASRATLALTILLWCVLAVLAFAARCGRRAVLLIPAAGYLLVRLLTSPLLMANSGGALSTLAAREHDEGLVGNGNARLIFWRAALRLWQRHPVTGAGFDSFRGAGTAVSSSPGAGSSYVHNGLLQQLSDGGVLLAAAVALATLAPLTASAWRARRGSGRTHWLDVAVPLAAGGLLAHSCVDFDWNYPALAALFVVVLALRAPTQGRSTRAFVAPVLVLAAAFGLVATAHAGRVAGSDAASGWVAAAGRLVPDTALRGSGVCAGDLASTDAARRAAALACTARAAHDDPWLQQRRALALAATDRVTAVRLARSTAAALPQLPSLELGLDRVLIATGHGAEAAERLRTLRASLPEPADAGLVQAIEALSQQLPS